MEYLVHWQGYSPYESSWEPHSNITRECIDYFNKPQPREETILNEVSRLRVNFECYLKNKQRGAVTIDFRGDVFKFLFKGKGKEQRSWVSLDSSHFSRKYFPPGWDKLCDMHGQGLKACYPVKLRHFISWSPKKFIKDKEGNLKEAPRAYTEKLSFQFVKVSGGLE